MRAPGIRIRWFVALALLLMGARAESRRVPQVPFGDGTPDALVLASKLAQTSALPAPTWSAAVESGSDLVTPRVRRASASRPAVPRSVSEGSVTGPTPAGRHPRPSSASLLGLPAAPANAPPLF